MLVGGNHVGKATDVFDTSKQQLVGRDIKEKEEDNAKQTADNLAQQAGNDPTSGQTDEGNAGNGDNGPGGGADLNG